MRDDAQFDSLGGVATHALVDCDPAMDQPSPDRPRAVPRAGWRRLLPRNYRKVLGGLASLALFCLAAYVLGQTLAAIRFADLRSAIAEMSGAQILAALASTALSYFALTGYDVVALFQVGARAPYRVAALASFTSYAVSFNLGFPVITGAAVRYWVYSRVKLTAPQVANVTICAAVTFWLGMIAVLGVGLVASAGPLSSIDKLPVVANVFLGVLTLGAIVYYCVWVGLGRRRAELRGHSFELPGPRTTLAQVALCLVDVCSAAGALFVLLPQGHGLDFGAFLAVYVLACILGVLSHAPGGIGVFEATMLHAIPAHSRESLLASLVLFRVIYYFIPFVIALALLGADEGSRRWGGLREAILRGVRGRE